MKKALLILAFTAFPSYAMAQPKDVPPECRVLEEHRPSSDVAYKPGVDVYGKPVVPADVNANTPIVAKDQNIVVPLTVDLAQRLHGMNVQGMEMESTLGFLEFSPDGHVTYNGQDLTSQVHVLCDGAKNGNVGTVPQDNMKPPAPKNPAKPAAKPVSANGQKPANTLKYPPVKEIKPEPVAPAPVPPPKKAKEQGALIEGQDYKE